MKANRLLRQDSLLKELGLTELDNSQQSELFALMIDILEVKILDRILSELSEKEQKEFTVILLGENVDAAREYLDKRITNLDKKLAEVVIAFKGELHDDIAQAKKALLKK